MEINKYLEDYKDPRWQKKRLQIMERDKFSCKICDDSKNTLNVHHKYYIFLRKPWEYPDELLITLCQSCHLKEEECKYIINDFTKVLLSNGFTNQALCILLDGLIKQLQANE
jgi:5-methylcytosine-specific restriction endonuclease McrA